MALLELGDRRQHLQGRADHVESVDDHLAVALGEREGEGLCGAAYCARVQVDFQFALRIAQGPGEALSGDDFLELTSPWNRPCVESYLTR